jgi:hypothetical protein
MRKMALVLWAGLAWGDASVPSDAQERCLQSIDRLAAQHPERRWHKSVTKQQHILFQALGPEEKAGIFVTLAPDPRSDSPWVDQRRPTLAGFTPEAAWSRARAHHFATITVWHTDLGLVPELQRLLDDCASSL